MNRRFNIEEGGYTALIIKRFHILRICFRTLQRIGARKRFLFNDMMFEAIGCTYFKDGCKINRALAYLYRFMPSGSFAQVFYMA